MIMHHFTSDNWLDKVTGERWNVPGIPPRSPWVQICKCEKKTKSALEKGARYWFYLWIAGLTNFKRLHITTSSQTKPHQRPHRRKTLHHHHHHRTKYAFLKCGFISCIRVRYRFSCTSCKYPFVHWHTTHHIWSSFVLLLERGGSSSFTRALFDSS